MVPEQFRNRQRRVRVALAAPEHAGPRCDVIRAGGHIYRCDVHIGETLSTTGSLRACPRTPGDSGRDRPAFGRLERRAGERGGGYQALT